MRWLGRVALLSLALAVPIPAVVALGAVPAQAQSLFRPDVYAGSGAAYRATLSKLAKSLTKPPAQLQREFTAARDAGNARATAVALEPLLARSPDDQGLWARLAGLLATADPLNDQDAAELPEKILGAAYQAWHLAKTPDDKATGLALMSGALARKEMWRPAIQLGRASLALAANDEVQKAVDDLVEQHGFRITDYTVESDAVEPRACFQFSDPLSRGATDFAPFFTQEPGPVSAVTVEGDKLCLEGLKHGTRYHVVARQGLPSAVDDTLPKPFEYDLYVRDRSPAVRFASKSYVLPRTGQTGIPLISTNSRSATLTVYRIGDRSLASAVIDSTFLQQLYGYGAEELGKSKGQKVWQGSMDTVAPLNRDVTTAFPVGEALGGLKPGLYAMTAAAAEKPSQDGQLATQWFVVSDLGLSTMKGKDGLHATLRSLADARPLPDVEVRLIARDNEVLGTARTDASGTVAFEPGLTRGTDGQEPALVVASTADDYGFVDLTQSPFDLTDRGVAGREPPGAVDAFVYAERGVYRRGETVHAAVLLRDDAAKAMAGVPATVVVERPDGVEYSRAVLADGGAGGRTLDIPISAAASGGTWQIKAYTDPKRPPVGATSFLVEDYVPDRIEFDLSSADTRIPRDKGASLTIDGRYLFGAPGAGLDIEGDVSLAPDDEPFEQWKGYRFGLTDESVTAVQTTLSGLPQTDAKGHAAFVAALPEPPTTTRPLKADITVRLREPGGRAVAKSLTLPVAGSGPLLGIKPAFGDDGVREGEPAAFDLIAVDPDGKPLAKAGVRWTLKRLTTSYQWYEANGSWNYEPVTRASKLADGSIDIGADAPAHLSRGLDFGQYRLEIAADGLEPASVDFSTGFFTSAKADTPDMLPVALDHTAVKTGDTVVVRIAAAFEGKASVQVVGDRLLSSALVDVPKGGLTVPVKVGEGWGTGAYVVVTMVRPLDVAAKRMPGRAIGLAWFGIDRAERTLAVSLSPPTSMKPRAALAVPVKVTGLPAGEKAYVTLAAVDVGILNLTGYEPPDPDGFYYGQKRLSAELRDIYGQLIDGMGGVKGRIRNGGDSGAGELQAPPPSQAPLADFSGIVPVGPDGTATIEFAIPAFNGTVRLMAVAWTATQVGHASADVVVRDPVVIAGTLPRFLAVGDKSRVRFDLVNAEAPPGDYTLSIAVDGPLTATGVTQTVKLGAAGSRVPVILPVTATGIGTARLVASLTGPGGIDVDQGYALNVEAANPSVTRRSIQAIAAGASLSLTRDLTAEMVPGTGSVALSLGPLAELDVPALLRDLDRYPYGCSEQLVSRALPLLYLADLGGDRMGLDADVQRRLADTVTRLLDRQTGAGAFGLWDSGDAEDLWLSSFVTDFLLRAREKGFAVPQTALTNAVDYLRNRVGNAPEVEQGRGEDIAYALYTLARAGRAPAGDLKYFADTKIGDFGSALAQAQVGAALGLIGDRARAGAAFNAAVATLKTASGTQERSSRSDYGSVLRDAAAIVALAGDAGGSPPVIRTAAKVISAERGRADRATTQEMTWMVLAARAMADRAKDLAFTVDGEAVTGALYRTWTDDALATPVTVVDTGPSQVRAVVTVQGSPQVAEAAAQQGLTLTRAFFTTDGKPVDPKTVKQNTRLVVVLTADQPVPAGQADADQGGDGNQARPSGHYLLVDHLPAGFEIENPDLVGGQDATALPWLTDTTTVVHSEFRDDRFVAAFDAPAAKLAYMVRAVAPGRYGLPGATVEDMYRPELFARTAASVVTVSEK